MTPEEKAEIAKAMRNLARDTFTAGFMVGRKMLTDGLDEVIERKAAELAFEQFESKLQKVYGERN